MSVIRHYAMVAAPGAAQRLSSALVAVRSAISEMPGCEGVEVLRDIGKSDRFILIERWSSIEAHESCLAALPADIVSALISSVDGALDGAYLTNMSEPA